MEKKYVVRLSPEERKRLTEVVKKLKGTSQKVRRAQILLKADVHGPNWTDAKIAEALDCRTKTVENVRQRLLTQGIDVTLKGQQGFARPTTRVLDGKQEAQVIAMRLGSPPAGYGSWTLRLLAQQLVELEVVEAISHETVRRTLKKMG